MSPWRRGLRFYATIGGVDVPLRTTDAKVARKREAELRTQHDEAKLGLRPSNLNPRGMTMAEAVAFHLAGPARDQAQREKLTPTLRKHITRDALGTMRLEQVTRAVVAEWLQRRQDADDLSPTTVNRLRANLSAIFTGLIEAERWLGSNPVEYVRVRRQQQPEPKALPWEWVIPAIEHMGSSRWQVAAAMAAFTGARRGEIERARWEHIEGRFWMVGQTKTGVRRVVPLHAELVALLDQYAPSDRRGLIVDGIGWEKSAPVLRRALVRAGMEQAEAPRYSWHGLRSTWTSRMLDCGADPYTVRLIAWGASDVMGRHYARPSSALLAAIDLLSYSVGEVKPMRHILQNAVSGQKVVSGT